VSITKNAYIESATLRLTFDAVGASWPGAKVYAKKVAQNTIVTLGDAGYDWVSGGKLTTSYLQIPSHTTMTAGAKSYDVTDILLELMAAPDWDETTSFIQFVVIPDAACPDADYTLSWDRTDGSGGSWAYLTFLDVEYYEHAGNAETAAITSGFVANYLPISDTDVTVADTLRFVVQDNTGGRESGVIVPADSAETGFFTGTTRNTTRKTIALSGGDLFELPPEQWTTLPQARLFGRKYTNHADLISGSGFVGSLGYTDGWRFLPENYDYLWAVSCEWESSDSLASIWDVFNFATYPTAQSFVEILANPTTGTVSLDLNTGTRVTESIASITAGAGRTLRVMLFWDHIAATWYWRVVVENSSGASIVDSSGSALVAAVWDADNETALGKNKKWLTGFRINSGARLFGHVIIEWQASASGVWESTADWMTKSWVRGIKSLDPRLMAP
jgi:hypothetical protein